MKSFRPILFLALSLASAAANGSDDPIKIISVSDRHGAGFVNADGQIVVPLKYRNTDDFFEGLARVQDASRKWGYMAPDGTWAISPQFKGCSDFHEGLARAKHPVIDRWGYVDHKGSWSISSTYHNADEFHEGFAAVKITPNEWAYINRDGLIQFAKTFDTAYDFSEGLASVRVGKEHFYIDHRGRRALNCKCDGAFDFIDGQAIIRRGSKYLLLNKTGVERELGIFDSCFELGKGLIKVRKDGRWRIMNRRTLETLPVSFKELYHAAEDGTAVAVENGRYGVIDAHGAWIIPPRFDGCMPHPGGYHEVWQDRRSFLFDKNQHLVWGATYEFKPQALLGWVAFTLFLYWLLNVHRTKYFLKKLFIKTDSERIDAFFKYRMGSLLILSVVIVLILIGYMERSSINELVDLYRSKIRVQLPWNPNLDRAILWLGALLHSLLFVSIVFLTVKIFFLPEGTVSPAHKLIPQRNVFYWAWLAAFGIRLHDSTGAIYALAVVCGSVGILNLILIANRYVVDARPLFSSQLRDEIEMLALKAGIRIQKIEMADINQIHLRKIPFTRNYFLRLPANLASKDIVEQRNYLAENLGYAMVGHNFLMIGAAWGLLILMGIIFRSSQTLVSVFMAIFLQLSVLPFLLPWGVRRMQEADALRLKLTEDPASLRRSLEAHLALRAWYLWPERYSAVRRLAKLPPPESGKKRLKIRSKTA